MSKQIFNELVIGGFLVICYLSLILPKDPFQTIPALTMFTCDKPLWFCIALVGNFFYLLILSTIYDTLEQKK